jgi:7,8-dihydropterin-6-yl-methyl-4-(beta-D-ribofuranosyl)aminobenzene 5'-phosphate synthase
MDKLEIVSLVDNYVVHPRHSTNGLLGEHGLSFLISGYGEQILFDVGRGATIEHNLKLLGADFNKVDHIILIHGHSDHAGGLGDALKNTGAVKVYVHPDIFKTKYSIGQGKKPRRTKGLPKNKEEYESMGAEFILRREKISIEEKLCLLGPISRVKPSDDLYMPNRYIKEGSLFKNDPFTDEQVLAINTPAGLLLVLGCTHNGLENTVEQVREMMNEERVYGIIGGLHLCDTSPQKQKELALWLEKLGVEILVCGHCTGFEAVIMLNQILGNRVLLNHVGKKTTVLI